MAAYIFFSLIIVSFVGEKHIFNATFFVNPLPITVYTVLFLLLLFYGYQFFKEQCRDTLLTRHSFSHIFKIMHPFVATPTESPKINIVAQCKGKPVRDTITVHGSSSAILGWCLLFLLVPALTWLPSSTRLLNTQGHC